jgi:tetratricopeptide (TPR) repeat protein
MMITRGDFEAARGAFELSIALKTQALGANHSDNAIGFMSLGLALKGLGKLDAALAAEDRALAIWTAQGSYWAMKALNNRGEILTALGRYREADDSFQRVLQAFEKEVGPDNVDVAYPLAGLGAVKLATRASVAAVPLFERALRLRQSTKTDPSLVAEAQFGLARALWDSGGDRARARSLAQQARATYENSHDATVRRQLDDWLAGRAGARAN